MKKLLLALLVVGVLALDWAALHDITSGREPGYALEYTFLALSAVLFGALALRWHRFRRSRLET